MCRGAARHEDGVIRSIGAWEFFNGDEETHSDQRKVKSELKLTQISNDERTHEFYIVLRYVF